MKDLKAIAIVQRKVDHMENTLNDLAYNITHYFQEDEQWQFEANRNYLELLEKYQSLEVVLRLAKNK